MRSSFRGKLANILVFLLVLSGLTSCLGTSSGPGSEVPSLNGQAVLSGPGSQGAAPEGTMGSVPESAILPSFGALYFTMPGRPTEFNKNLSHGMDYNIWFMDEPRKQYEEEVTLRYYYERSFPPGTVIPESSPCPQNILENGILHITCQGEFPFATGHMLRLIICGQPNYGAIPPNLGNSASAFHDYLDRAWVKGDDDVDGVKLWDIEVCPERRYVDYVLYGPNIQIRFPLEAGKLYFITQFPKDYLRNMQEYGAPVPNHLGIHNRTYPTSRLMSNFLHHGRIVQVVMGVHMPQRSSYVQADAQGFHNMTLENPPEPPGEEGEIVDGVPGNQYCQSVEDWDPERVAKEVELFHLVNDIRAQGYDCNTFGNFDPVHSLDMDPTLRCAARAHSQYMNDRIFSHFNVDDPKYMNEWNRIYEAGFNPPLPDSNGMDGSLFSGTAENIAQGPGTALEVRDLWLASDGHCANLMNPAFNKMGTGYHEGNDMGPLWTITLGTDW